MTEDDPLLAQAQARIGTVLREKYTIDRLLGVGGMAAVYAATHRNRQRFAIKVLHPQLSVNQFVRTRFLREGYVANTVQHRGAVTVIDDDVAEDGAAFLVMELLEGETVEGVWKRHDFRLPLPPVLAIAFQLLDVLASAHAHSVVHRDIKPANLFLTHEGLLKVLDFGIARMLEGTSSASLTQGLVGTPAFMAPEQALGQSQAVDGRTDIWAVGATMFSLLSGATVHEGESAQSMVIRAATSPARPLLSVVPGVPAAIASVVDRALAFDRAQRWQSADEMRNAVAAVYEQTFSSPLSDAPLRAILQRPSIPPRVSAIPAAVSERRRPSSPPEAIAGPRAPDSRTGAPASRTVGSTQRAGAAWAAAAIGILAVTALAAGGWWVARTRRPTAPAASTALVATASVSSAPSAAPAPAASRAEQPSAGNEVDRDSGPSIDPVPPPRKSAAAPTPLPPRQPASASSNGAAARSPVVPATPSNRGAASSAGSSHRNPLDMHLE